MERTSGHYPKRIDDEEERTSDGDLQRPGRCRSTVSSTEHNDAETIQPVAQSNATTADQVDSSHQWTLNSRVEWMNLENVSMLIVLEAKSRINVEITVIRNIAVEHYSTPFFPCFSIGRTLE